jgi:hypothetical protein
MSSTSTSCKEDGKPHQPVTIWDRPSRKAPV